MPTVFIDLAEKSYEVHVDNGLLPKAGELMRQKGISQNIALISNETVFTLYGSPLIHSLEQQGFRVTPFVIPPGEQTKSLSQAERISNDMASKGFDRKSAIVALGGGVIGDLAGFIASIYYRGIPFVQIPTTILSQVDSSVGGKTGVNLPAGKNLIGAFHHPRLVIADTETLLSLPKPVLIEGVAEMIKHAAIRDADMIPLLEKTAPRFSQGDIKPILSLLPGLIARNVAIKARIVEADEKETLGLRALLNFGHTIGHGIEAAVPYGELLHGEAVSLGMRAALYLSVKHAALSREEESRLLRLMHDTGLPMTLPASISQKTIMEKLSKDKKFEAGQIRFVLIKSLGDAVVSSSLSAGDMADGIDHLFTPWEA